MILTHQITVEEGGIALLHILRHSMGLSGAQVKALKAYGGLHVDGVLRFTTYIVSPGEVVSADVTRAQGESDNIPETGPLDILYEDEGLIAVNKPPGLIVHPSFSRYTGTLANYVAGYLAQSGQRPVCHIVNRLDRDTSGVVLFAKNAHMKAKASVALTAGEKRYTAMVWGALEPPDGTIDLPIRRLQLRDMFRIVAPDGKRAVTHYRTVTQTERLGYPITTLELTLETGRTHQIRVHCLAMGAPLVGDSLYHTEQSKTRSETLGIGHQLLHSHHLGFRHPLTGTAVVIKAAVGFGLP